MCNHRNALLQLLVLMVLMVLMDPMVLTVLMDPKGLMDLTDLTVHYIQVVHQTGLADQQEQMEGQDRTQRFRAPQADSPV